MSENPPRNENLPVPVSASEPRELVLPGESIEPHPDEDMERVIQLHEQLVERAETRRQAEGQASVSPRTAPSVAPRLAQSSPSLAGYQKSPGQGPFMKYIGGPFLGVWGVIWHHVKLMAGGAGSMAGSGSGASHAPKKKESSGGDAHGGGGGGHH